jgi:hypothetical protein
MAVSVISVFFNFYKNTSVNFVLLTFIAVSNSYFSEKTTMIMPYE